MPLSAQNKIWGKISADEAALQDVSFEKGAAAVVLLHQGLLTLNNSGYRVEEYMRIKILSADGFAEAQRSWTYRSGTREKVTFVAAQTLNLVGNQVVAIPVSENDLFINKVSNGVEELAFAFPAVQVGSIVEFRIIHYSENDWYDTPWYFQNALPTLESSLSINNRADFNYRLILSGSKIQKKYENRKKIKSWQLTNLPSYQQFKKVYNLQDYREKLMFQYLQKYGGSYYSENSWKNLTKLLSRDADKILEKADIAKIAAKIADGSNDFETLQNCIQFLRSLYKWNEQWAPVGNRLTENLFSSKTGNSADFNVLLKNILELKKIKAELAIISMRNNGKIFVDRPAVDRLQSVVNLVTLESGEKLLIEAATADPNDLRFPSLNLFNHFVVVFNGSEVTFTLMEPPLSEFRSSQKLSLTDGNSKVYVQSQKSGYFRTEAFSDNVFNVFDGVKSTEKNHHAPQQTLTSYTIDSATPQNAIILIENPIEWLVQELTVSAERDYPIELDFPFLATVQLAVRVPDDYVLQTDDFEKSLSAFGGQLQYRQETQHKGDEEVLIWSFLLNKSIFKPSEIPEYSGYLRELASIFSSVAVIKKK